MKNKLPSPSTNSSKKLKNDIRSFFKAEPQNDNKKVNDLKWEFKDNNSLLVGINKSIPISNKIAGFDLDSTLIKVKGKTKYPKDEFDWQWLYTNVITTIKDYHIEKGYSIVILTNQGGLNPEHPKSDIRTKQFRNKINLMAKELSIPFLVLAATQDNIYRKPRIGMWNYLDGLISNIDKENSFYIGDASGRQKNWKSGMEADHADTDRKLAMNLGIRFQVPEEFFQNHDPIPYQLEGFCPFNFEKQLLEQPNLSELLQPIFDNQPNLVLLIGLPASGKSSIVENYFEPKNYTHINQDTLKSKAKCISTCDSNLSRGNSVIIDNTNITTSIRKPYLDLAKKHNIPSYAIVFNTDIHLCRHNNNVRSLLPDSIHSHVPKFVFQMQQNKYEVPNQDEGFDQIIELPFIPSFQSKLHEKLWKSYTY